MKDDAYTTDALDKVKCMRLRLEEVAAQYPEADPDNIWHTLVLLNMKPIERLANALRRGQISHIR